MLKTKRVYETAIASDGVRFLVERLWPHGIKKEKLKMKAWLKDVAPSDALRRWFGHDPTRWEEFKQRYIAELEKNRGCWKPLLEAAAHGTVTLLYSSHDRKHNNAVALMLFLAEWLKNST